MQKIFLRYAFLAPFLVFLLGAEHLFASDYKRQELLITMRDGVKLNTVIFTPKKTKGNLPFLFLRTPYGVSDSDYPDESSYTKEMADDGYIFVFQDIRGRYKS